MKFMNFLDPYKEHAYALMRIVAGFLFIWHGTQKYFDFPSPYPWGELDMLSTAAGGIELIGGVLILIGLLTRIAAFICSGLMAVAYWMAHAPDSNPIFPIINGGELAILFCFVFLYVACRGPGMWSVDSSRS